jgi:hypothetical protein
MRRRDEARLQLSHFDMPFLLASLWPRYTPATARTATPPVATTRPPSMVPPPMAARPDVMPAPDNPAEVPAAEIVVTVPAIPVPAPTTPPTAAPTAARLLSFSGLALIGVIIGNTVDRRVKSGRRRCATQRYVGHRLVLEDL